MKKLLSMLSICITTTVYGAAPGIDRDELEKINNKELNAWSGVNVIDFSKAFTAKNGKSLEFKFHCVDELGKTGASIDTSGNPIDGESTIFESCETDTILDQSGNVVATGTSGSLVVRTRSRGEMLVYVTVRHLGEDEPKSAFIKLISLPREFGDNNDGPIVRNSPENDYRRNFNIDLYLGFINNSFSPSQRGRYINQGDVDNSDTSGTLEIKFEYRADENIWLFGQTIRTRRLAEIECLSEARSPACESFGDQSISLQDRIDNVVGSSNGFDSALAFLKDARSIEGYVGVRYEFEEVMYKSRYRAKPYVRLSAGFASVENVDDLADIHQATVGYISHGNTNFRGTFFEIGYGINDLYVENSEKRFLLNTRLQYAPKGTLLDFGGNVTYFLESNLDADFGNGPDSYRTRGGIEVNL